MSRDKLRSMLITGVLFLSIPAAIVVGAFSSIGSNVPTCETSTIPYETVRENDPDTDAGEEYTETEGEDGLRQTCVNEDGVEVSNQVVFGPVNEVIKVGTYVEPTTVYEESDESYEYNEQGCPKNQYVRGYVNSNGTYVEPYMRNSPTDNCY